MAPLEGGVLVDFARLGGLAHRQRLIERPRKAEPALLLRNRASGVPVNGLKVRWQSGSGCASGRSSPGPSLQCGASRSAGICDRPRGDEPEYAALLTIAALLQRRDHLLSLRVRQFRDQFIEPLRNLRYSIGSLLRIRTPRTPIHHHNSTATSFAMRNIGHTFVLKRGTFHAYAKSGKNLRMWGVSRLIGRMPRPGFSSSCT